MISPSYLKMHPLDQIDFLSRLIILAQSEEGFATCCDLIAVSKDMGLFDKVQPGDPSHPHIKDLDAGPIENGPSSQQN